MTDFNSFLNSTNGNNSNHQDNSTNFQQALRLHQQEQQLLQAAAAAAHGGRQGPPILPSAEDKDEATMNHQDDTAAGAASNSNNPAGQSLVFPVKLHRMLTQIDDRVNSSDPAEKRKGEEEAAVVSWQPHGRCFLVHDKEAFVKTFLPSYFRQSKWASFQRQLNIYGFHRLTAGRDRGAYYNELFLRGHPDLAARIHRQKLKGIGQGRHRTNAELEPNFYRMKPVGAGDPIDLSQITTLTANSNLSANRQNALAGATSMNVLQLFGGATAAAAAQAQLQQAGLASAPMPSLATGNGSSGNGNLDLSSLLFLSGGSAGGAGDLTGSGMIANTSSGTAGNAMPSLAGNPSQLETYQAVQQNGNSSASLLANFFNNSNSSLGIPAAATVGIGDTGSGAMKSTLSDLNLSNLLNATQDHTASNTDVNSNELLTGNSSLAPYLQNTADANLITTAQIMQFMADGNSDGSGSNKSQSPPTTGNSNVVTGNVNATALQQQSPWHPSLAALAGSSHQPPSFSLNALTTGTENASGNASSFRRMSTAAMNTLLGAQLGGSASLGGGGNDMPSHEFDISQRSGSALRSSNGGFGSNPNLLLFNSLQRGNSSNNLLQFMETSNPDTTGAATAALSRLAAQQQHQSSSSAATSSSNAFHSPAAVPVPAPASEQLALLTGNSSNNNGNGSSSSGLLFADHLRGGSHTSGGAPTATFLDSVYEPIPIKENNTAGGSTSISSRAMGNSTMNHLPHHSHTHDHDQKFAAVTRQVHVDHHIHDGAAASSSTSTASTSNVNRSSFPYFSDQLFYR